MRSQTTSRSYIWIVGGLAIIGALLVAAGLGAPAGEFAAVAPILIFFAAAGGCALLFLSIGLAADSRQRRGASVLSYLEQAVRLNLPLPAILIAARLGQRGGSAHRLRQLQQHIENGAPLGAALEASVPELPARTIRMIAAAERIGRLQLVLARLRREQRQASQSDLVNVAFYQFYPVMMLMVSALVISIIGVYFLPRFQQIFIDFGATLPAITTETFRLAFVVAPWILPLIAVILLWAGFRTIWWLAFPLRRRRGVSRSRFDYITWRIPVLHSLELDRGLADVFTFLGDAADAHMPLHVALAEASSLHVNRVLHQRLLVWEHETTQGTPLHEGAQKAMLPAFAVGMLGNITRREDAASVFRFLARYYGGRFSRSTAVIQAAIVPAMVLFFGLLVCVILLSVFMPMTQLIGITAIKTGL